MDEQGGKDLWKRLRQKGARGATSACPETGTWAAYLDGLASPAEVDSLEGHLVGCAACLEMLVALSEIAREGPFELPPSVVRRAKDLVAVETERDLAPLRKRIFEWRRASKGPSLPRPLAWVAAAAAVVLACAGGFAIGRETFANLEEVALLEASALPVDPALVPGSPTGLAGGVRHAAGGER